MFAIVPLTFGVWAKVLFYLTYAYGLEIVSKNRCFKQA